MTNTNLSLEKSIFLSSTNAWQGLKYLKIPSKVLGLKLLIENELKTHFISWRVGKSLLKD